MGWRCGMMAMLGLVLAGVEAARCGEVVVGNEILGGKEAADLILQARSFDPNFARSEKADRDQAAAFYERAIAIQPGAKINAVLADRVAQIYAFYEDRKKGIRPDPAKAVSWWGRCIEMTTPRQLLWGQAYMGMGCASFTSGRAQAAADAFRAILKLDPEQMELPDWRVWSPGQAEQEKARVRELAKQLRLKAIDKVHYALIRADGAVAVAALLDIAKAHKGTPVGQHASLLAAKTMREAKTSIFRHTSVALTPMDDLTGPAKESESAEGRTPAIDVAHPKTSVPSVPTLPPKAAVKISPRVEESALPKAHGFPSWVTPWAFGGAALGVVVAVVLFVKLRRVP